MRRPVPSHRNPTGYVPARETFEPFIERNSSGHWYWDGDFKTFDTDKYAILRAPLAPVGIHRKHNGLYIVVRALWAYANSATGVPRIKLFNTCGCVPCVNPAHVERETRGSRVTLPTGATMHDGVSVVMCKQGTRVHIIPSDVAHAVCGWRVREHLDVPAGAVITCVECVSMWRARGYPLQEVP